MVDKFLLYIDILGFERLCKEIASMKGIDQRDVRKKFIDVIKEKIGKLEAKGRIIGKKYGKSDDWLLVVDALDKTFNCIHEIFNHNTGYKNYEKIPLEIAIGRGEYDKWAKFDGTNLIVEESTLEFYRTQIIGHYRELYEKRHHQSIETSFIILTESVYIDLEPLDKKICHEIKHIYKKDGGREKIITFFDADVDKVLIRGRSFEFLEKIEYVGNKWYGRIGELYVPPIEYDEIANTLNEKRIVFITGPQEYGKTYTAVRFLWEYFNRGYEPKFIRGGEDKERVEVRQKLENIIAVLKPGCITYFEDPFGQTKYEDKECLEKEIGTIIDSIRQAKDAFVIITSREEIFKEFEKEKLSSSDLKEFEGKLNIKKPSYNYEKKKEILLNLAEEENCKWIRTDLKYFVLYFIKNYENILPTPLSIKHFVLSTINIEDKDKLEEKIKEKSKETAKAFAKEIKNMTDDKILFLMFPFISNYFELGFIREVYHELVKEIELKEAWEFERILYWFKDDKINIKLSGYQSPDDGTIEFSHTSYSEALNDLLVEDGYITRVNKELYSKLLLKLSDKDKAAGYVARNLSSNFNIIPIDIRNELLLKLSEKNISAEEAAIITVNNFDTLSEGVRNELLHKLSDKNEAAGYVARNLLKNVNPFQGISYITEKGVGPEKVLERYSIIPFKYLLYYLNMPINCFFVGRTGVGKTMTLKLFDFAYQKELYSKVPKNESMENKKNIIDLLPKELIGIYSNIDSPYIRLTQFQGRTLHENESWMRVFGDYYGHIFP